MFSNIFSEGSSHGFVLSCQLHRWDFQPKNVQRDRIRRHGVGSCWRSDDAARFSPNKVASVTAGFPSHNGNPSPLRQSNGIRWNAS